MTPAELLRDPWAHGSQCWVIDQVRALPKPIPCRGMPGLWPMGDLARALAALDPEIPARLRALTVLQPFASAIVAGPKRVENREWGWTIPPGGLWIGIHAGTSLYVPEDEVRPYRECRRTRSDQAREWVQCELDCWRIGPDPVFPQDPHWPDAPDVGDLPLGALLGAVRIAEIVRYPEAP